MSKNEFETNNSNGGSWTQDVLDCVNSIESDQFSLNEVYAYRESLQAKHINNHNIEAKIRQQLQILRDRGFLEFLGGGHYKKNQRAGEKMFEKLINQIFESSKKDFKHAAEEIRSFVDGMEAGLDISIVWLRMQNVSG